MEAPLSIVMYGEPALHQPTELVKEVTEDVMRTASRMARAMAAVHGVGISAPQIGSNLRMSLISALMPAKDDSMIMADPKGEQVLLINPQLEWHGEHQVLAPEGCLSIDPYVWKTGVKRWYRVRVSYLDAAMNVQTWTAKGAIARILQHELDHLDGKLIVDGLPRQQRRAVERIAMAAR
jgi:peptide deformylase